MSIFHSSYNAAFVVLPFIGTFPFFIAACVTDFKEHRLPNKLVLLCSFAVLTCIIIGGIALGQPDLIGRSVRSAIYALIVFGLLHTVSKTQLGMGDVKFSVPCGFLIGWYVPNAWLLWIWISFATAAVTILPGLLSKRLNRHQAIAFGPYMYFAVCAVICQSFWVAN